MTSPALPGDTCSTEPVSFWRIACLSILLGACAAMPPRGATRATLVSDAPAIHNLIGIQVGSKTIDDANDLDVSDVGANETVDVGDQVAVGFQYSSIGDSGFGGEVGISYSSADDDVDVMGTNINLELSIIEVLAGVRFTIPGLGNFLPCFGGGVALLSYEVEGEADGASASASETDFGLYAHVGAAYAIGGHFLVGADLRGVFGTSDDLDSTQVSGFIGWGF